MPFAKRRSYNTEAKPNRPRPERSPIIHIIQHTSVSKNQKEANEDALVVTDHFIAVVDGVTSKIPMRYDEKTSGRLAMEIVRQRIKQLPPRTTVHQFVDAVNEDFAEKWRSMSLLRLYEQQFQAVTAVYSRHYRQIWLIGDCQLLIDGRHHENPKKSDSVLSEMRSLILTLHESRSNDPNDPPTGEDEGRSFILPWIQQACRFANRDIPDYGYAVLNGEPVPERLLRIFQLDEEPHEIVLASDGYPWLESTLEQTEDRLQKQLREDPLCYKQYRSTKGRTAQAGSFDDRTYVKFQI